MTVATAARPRADRSPTSVATAPSIRSVSADWDELAGRLRSSPFLRPRWFAAWWRAFGSGELELLVARRGGALRGVLPLARREGRLDSASNWHSPVFGLLAEDDAARSSLARALFAGAPRRAALAFLEPETGDLSLCEDAARKAGYRVLTRVLERSPYVALEGDWELFVRGRGKHVRSDLPRQLRRLEGEGRVRFELADGSERLDELLAEGFAIESSGWKGRTAIVSDAATHVFYTDVARWLAEEGWLRLLFLRLDGRAIAFQYNVVHDGSWYHVKGGYDPAFARFSPGRLIARAALEQAFSLGLSTYEFLGGDEPYKLQWTSTCRERLLFQTFAPTLAGLLDWSVHAHLRPLAKRLGLGPVVLSLRR